ncbi:extracellular solute-binding protein [Streptomyces sp. NPDC017248]|uniref:extracellular solute-binding protein n=1 Tax=unclassified Streptomyces TaxID=2593676 RepID=UPI0037873658
MTIRYSWWGAEARAEGIHRSATSLAKKYLKTGGKADFRTYQSFRGKFPTQAAGGNPPDVFQSPVTFLRKCDKRGILLDLKPQVQAGHLRPDHFRAGRDRVPARGSGGAPSHGRRRSSSQRAGGHGPAHEYPYSDPRPRCHPPTPGRLTPWTGTTTVSAACGPCPHRPPTCTRHWSGPRTTPAGGPRCGR